MSDTYYKVTSTNPHTDWTAEVVLERDDEGNATKSVVLGVPSQLNQDDRKALEALGYTVESSTKSEAEEIVGDSPQIAQQAGGDVAAAGPTFGTSTDQPNQQTGDDNPQGSRSGSGKTR